MNTFLSAYIECALWSSTDDSGEPLDSNYFPSDLSEKALTEMEADCADFQQANAELLMASGLSDEQAGHDFWLTRNGHGAGFWDRGLGEVGKALTAASKPYGSQDLYVGDDGQIYI